MNIKLETMCGLKCIGKLERTELIDHKIQQVKIE